MTYQTDRTLVSKTTKRLKFHFPISLPLSPLSFSQTYTHTQKLKHTHTHTRLCSSLRVSFISESNPSLSLSHKKRNFCLFLQYFTTTCNTVLIEQTITERVGVGTGPPCWLLARWESPHFEFPNVDEII